MTPYELCVIVRNRPKIDDFMQTRKVAASLATMASLELAERIEAHPAENRSLVGSNMT